uniref:Uncharacterized protein n=1 Tax=Glossina austeni TaxID=7395 RepID=A0A1A9UYI7_GLOAU
MDFGLCNRSFSQEEAIISVQLQQKKEGKHLTSGYAEASERVQQKRNPPLKKGPRNPRPKQEAEPAIRPSTTQTAPRDEPLYTGNNRGSKPVKKTLAQNMECAGFIPLIRQVYDRIAVEDQRIPRNLPYPIYQHAMLQY